MLLQCGYSILKYHSRRSVSLLVAAKMTVVVSVVGWWHDTLLSFCAVASKRRMHVPFVDVTSF